MATDGKNGIPRPLVFVQDEAVKVPAHFLIGDKVHVERGNIHIGLDQRHLGIVDHGLEQQPALVHFAQEILIVDRVQGGAKAEPARQIEAALHPGEDPGDGADLGHCAALAARSRAGADVQSLDLVQGRGSLPEIDEPRRLVHQLPVHPEPNPGHPVHDLPPHGWDLPHRLGRGGHQDRMDKLLQVAVRQLWIRVTPGDRLTLFGETETAIHTARRLGSDGAVGGTTAACDRPAAAMEDRQGDAMLLRDFGDLFLRLVECPVGGDVASILVAIGVSDHHHLGVAAGRQMLAIQGKAVQPFQDGGRGLQVFDRLKKRDDLHALVTALPAGEEQDGQDVALGTAHGDHERPQQFRAIHLAHASDQLEQGPRLFSFRRDSRVRRKVGQRLAQ